MTGEAKAVEPVTVVDMVNEYADSELRDAARYENRAPLDESGIWSLHRLAAEIYAIGVSAGEASEASRNRAQRRRDKDKP